MRTRFMRYPLLSLIMTICLTSPADAEDPQRVFQRFLERIRQDAPVAGEFHIGRRMTKPAYDNYLAEARQDAAKQGLGLIPAPARESDACRWAWDGQREMLDSHPDDARGFKSFFLTSEGLLDGMLPGNYNLVEPKKPYGTRPASFYYHAGAWEWTDVDERDSVELDPNPPADAPSDSITLMIRFGVRSKEQPQQVRLYLHRDDDRPLGRDEFVDGKLFRRVRVSDFQKHPDGRAFPAQGTMEIFDPAADNKVMQSFHMQAVRIDFPATEQELEAAFALALPAGTEIHDLLLNRELVLTSAVDAQELMKPTFTGWQPMESITSMASPAAVEPNDRKAPYRMLLGLNLVLLALLAAYFYHRVRRRHGGP